MNRPAPLLSPDRARELDALLRSCVQCGLCLPHCATYLATGNEADSPRGRLLLLGDGLAAGDAAPVPSVVAALDRCLGCRACTTACPSGVPAELLDTAKEAARAVLGPPGGAAAIRPTHLGALAGAAGLVERILRSLLGAEWRRRLDGAPRRLRRLARLLGSRPTAPDDRSLIRQLDGLTGMSTPDGARPATVSADDVDPQRFFLFPGCADRTLLADSRRRLVALLGSLGRDVVDPGGDLCCGALDEHAGRPAAAERLRERTQDVLMTTSASDPLLVESAGCALSLMEAETAGDRTIVGAAEALAAGTLPSLRRVPLRVVVHDPCHARHGRGVQAEPRALLDRIPGVTRLEAAESEVCCGSGGAYALIHPELSEAMGRRKASQLAATGADLVVTANPGCLGQIRDASLLDDACPPIVPLTDLLWYASLSAD